LFDRLVSDLIPNTQSRIKKAAVRSLSDVRKQPERLVAFSASVETERRAIKEFLYQHLYFSSALTPEKEIAERVVTELFAFWMKNPEALPHNYQEKAEQDPLARVVCDYIAGMTDNYILEQFEKYLGTR